MRWFWLDRFTEFVSGSHATAVKCVSLSEDYLQDHLPDYPIMPNSLVAEGMAQCGGLLVSEVYQFSELVVLAKFARCSVRRRSPAGRHDSLPGRHRTSQGFRRVGRRHGRHRRPPVFRGRYLFRPLRSRIHRANEGPRPVRPGRPPLVALRRRRVRHRYSPRRHPPPRRRLPPLFPDQYRVNLPRRHGEHREKNSIVKCKSKNDKLPMSHFAFFNLQFLLRALRVSVVNPCLD